MIDWLALFRRKKTVPLAGAPAVRRQKSYAAESGYVYQYYYLGHRPAQKQAAQGTEYFFEISADRQSSFHVPVFLAEDVIRGWEREHQRELNPTERYAVAKMALFQAFDEREAPPQMHEPVSVRQADVEGIMEKLDAD